MNTRKITQQEFEDVLRRHKKWLQGVGGERANLSNMDLRGLDFSNAILVQAIIERANMSGVKAIRANFSGASLAHTIMQGAILKHSQCLRTNFYKSIMKEANLYGCSLAGSSIEEAYLDESTVGVWPVCPEEGTFLGWAPAKEGRVVKLRILSHARRSSGTGRICRADKVEVQEILSGDKVEQNAIPAFFNDEVKMFVVGTTISVKKFDDERWRDFTDGILFFMSKEEALNY